MTEDSGSSHGAQRFERERLLGDAADTLEQTPEPTPADRDDELEETLVNESSSAVTLTHAGGSSSGPLQETEMLDGDLAEEFLRKVASDAYTEERLAPGRPFELTCEIARGGMGVVMRALDTDLHREVAVKLLKREFSRQPAALRRFIEEAQICGQLQHPGIVPVYETGLTADPPYFVMRLIKGRSFREVLLEREEVAQDLLDHLNTFEEVCQAMAYAHSRGVIHRDLKPANVMVGSFGVVQVVDWGLAKVRGRVEVEEVPDHTAQNVTRIYAESGMDAATASSMGAIVGTPAYLPPEQARGEAGDVDPRADVFGLGAILCEMLTGMPPFTGDRTTAVRASAQGDLSACFTRLDACKCEPQLVEITRQCLDPNPDRRPAHGGEVARRIQRFLATIDERAHSAELQAAEERARAEEERGRAKAERRSRQLAVGLLSLVALSIIGIATTLWIWREARLSQERQVTARAEDVLREGLDLWVSARSAPPGDLRGWDTALEVVGAGIAGLEAGVDEDVRARLEQLEDVLATDRAAAVAAGERRASEKQTLALLDDVLAAAASVSSDLLVPLRAGLVEVFAREGIHLDDDLDASAVGDRIARLRIAPEFVRALDLWAMSEGRGGHANRKRALLEVAQRADHDRQRREVRAAVLTEDETRLGELRDEVASANAFLLLVLFADAAGPSRELVQAARLGHPGDFWLNLALGRRLAPPEGLHYLTAATAIRPQSPLGWTMLASAQMRDGERVEALVSLSHALGLESGGERVAEVTLAALERVVEELATAPPSTAQPAEAQALGRVVLEDDRFTSLRELLQQSDRGRTLQQALESLR